jgi:serine O-acetyltransferase
LFDTIREDWRTYDRQLSRQGLWAIVVYRYGHWQHQIRNRWVRLPFSLLFNVLKPISEILTGIELPCGATIGRRFRIHHFGGIIIGGSVVFGDDCVIRNGVTVGQRHTGLRAAPVIGNRVDIGAGAKILGAIRIGDGAIIGANAVVLIDVPENAIAVGVPARILPRKRETPPVEGSTVHPDGELAEVEGEA